MTRARHLFSTLVALLLLTRGGLTAQAPSASTTFQAPDALARVLAMPITPASVALLAGHPRLGDDPTPLLDTPAKPSATGAAALQAASANPPAMSGSPPPRVRTSDGPIAAIFPDSMRTFGCKPAWTASVALAAEVGYHASGRPKRILIHPEKISAACQSAVSAATTLLARKASGTESGDLLMPFINADMFSCAAAARDDQPPVEKPSGDGVSRLLEYPRVTREIRPQHPRVINKPGDRWTVWIKALISSGGCVQEAETVRGDYLDFNQESLRVVSAWKFKPGTLDGRPVPMEVVVEVSFLNK